MPWTFAHPAAVLPLSRMGPRGLPMLGLVVGSLAPDFAYYVGRFDVATYAHSLAGSVVVGVPSALGVAVGLSRAQRLLVAPLPEPHRSAIGALAAPDLGTAGGVARMAVASLVGALTHLAWDSFTHAHGVAVNLLTPLQRDVGTVFGHPFHVFSVLQHASTALGVATLLVSYTRWLRRQTSAGAPRSLEDRVRRFELAACLVVSVVVGAALSLVLGASNRPIAVELVHAVISSSVVLAVCYVALALRVHRGHPA